MSIVNVALKKRIPALVVAAMMFFTVFAVLPTTELGKVYAAGETGKVTASELYVRSGAGTSYKKLGSVKKGYTFTVKGTAKDKSGAKWYKLTYKSKTGYVSSGYVDIIKPTVTPVEDLYGKVTAKKLKVRSGAGGGYSQIDALAKDTIIGITGKSTGINNLVWYRFSLNGKTAYVSSNYVKTSAPKFKVTEVSNLTGKVSASLLIVRSGPSTSHNRVGSKTKNETISINGKTTDKNGLIWYRFDYDDRAAYVSSNYIKTTTTVTEKEPEKPESDKEPVITATKDLVGTVTATSLKVRSGPSGSSEQVGKLPKNSIITITGKTKDANGLLWYRFSFNGKTAYVSSNYVIAKTYKPISFKVGITTASSGLNVRTGAGATYDILTTLTNGTVLTITGSEKDSNGKDWYTYQYSSSAKGYVSSDYVTIKKITSDSEFEAHLDSQGFPEDYKPALRLLHSNHPQWVFKAENVGYKWDDALAKESVVGRNLVSSSAPVKHRSKEAGSYNSKTKTWTKFDGSWYSADSKVIAHYMDPRNFISESGIYQFMTHSYDKSSQDAKTVAAVIKGSFMEGKNPGGGYSSYQALINAAGKATGVNPNVLAAMIIQEQGWNGSSLVSGTYKGYKGYYNFYNIGAYTTSTMSAVQRGLWYAKGSGTGATSYSRPWNTPYKSIKGGAQFYAEGYVSKNQDSYYSKKFNVYNGLSNVGSHQYMTFVAAASSEGNIVKRAYVDNKTYPVIFEIPVYNDMPAVKCPLP